MRILITGGSGFIGTNAVAYFTSLNHEVMNFDLSPPLDSDQAKFWRRGTILNPGDLAAAFCDFSPEAVIHLAARADCDENTTVEEGYRDNTDGVRHVLEAVASTPSVRRLILTSSQFVCGPNHPPKDDLDFGPVTIYGQSKVITEQLSREMDPACCWTIVRPTNIWGPWHQRYRDEFWKIAARGLYVHPGGRPVVRCYGYVGNLVFHLDRILQVEEDKVHGEVFYLSDPPDDIYRWANAFCLALRGRAAPRVPRWILKCLGGVGDVIQRVTGKPFYISSSRVRSMVSDYLVPGAIEKTQAVLGAAPYSLEDGVGHTVAWLSSCHSSQAVTTSHK